MTKLTLSALAQADDQKPGRSTEDNLTPKDFEAAGIKAASEGFVVVVGNDRLLLLDLDDRNARTTFDNKIELVDRMFGIENREEWASKSGGDCQHVAVTLKQMLLPLERIAIQAALGSDPTREILSVVRLRNGIAEPSRLFKPKEKP